MFASIIFTLVTTTIMILHPLAFPLFFVSLSLGSLRVRGQYFAVLALPWQPLLDSELGATVVPLPFISFFFSIFVSFNLYILSSPPSRSFCPLRDDLLSEFSVDIPFYKRLLLRPSSPAIYEHRASLPPCESLPFFFASFHLSHLLLLFRSMLLLLLFFYSLRFVLCICNFSHLRQILRGISICSAAQWKVKENPRYGKRDTIWILYCREVLLKVTSGDYFLRDSFLSFVFLLSIWSSE